MHSCFRIISIRSLIGVISLISITCAFAQTPQTAPSQTGTQILVDAPSPNGAKSPEPENPNPQQRAQHSVDPQTGDINGTVTDPNGDLIPGSVATLDDAEPGDRRTVVADDNAFFDFRGLRAGIAYTVTVKAKGFSDWTSPAMTLTPGQFEFLKGVELKPTAVTTITVDGSPEQIAVEQVQLAEKQRVLGFIPNFYVSYDANPAPLSAKLKFKLALRVSVDPITFLGAGFLAGINQASDTPDYVQGAKGYGQRMGAVYADGFTDLLFGGAILPSLLHQDPRYFYKGSGTKTSRALHAISNPFICRGDNGRLQPNYSSIGGDVIASAFSNAYYPASNRGADLLYRNVLINTGERTVSSLVQEFILRKLTASARTR